MPHILNRQSLLHMKRLRLKNEVGIKGEDIACKFLMKQGYKVLHRNYLKKWGEIDIVAKKEGIIHFVEVKSVSCESFEKISRVTNAFRPEDNLHGWKLERLGRVIQSYLLEQFGEGEDEPDWKFDVAIVYLDMKRKKGRVEFLEDIII